MKWDWIHFAESKYVIKLCKGVRLCCVFVQPFPSELGIDKSSFVQPGLSLALANASAAHFINLSWDSNTTEAWNELL